MQLYLYGCGGHGKVILDILRLQGRTVTALVDDNPPHGVTHIHGVPVWSARTALLTIRPQQSQWIVAIGNNAIRRTIAKQLSHQGHRFTTAIHPSAQLARGVHIGAGTVVMANAVINTDAQVGHHGIVNTAATIDHDCTIGDWVHIGPGTNLCGQVTLGDEVFLGVGTRVCPCLDIGHNTTCGAGSVVVHSLPEGCLAFGCPAKVVRSTRPVLPLDQSC